MTSKMTPDGSRGADALRAIREKLGPWGRVDVRPEEMALLQDWQAACDDPDRRRELTRIIHQLG